MARLLEQLRRLPHQPGEIIVVDAAGSRRCAQLCEQAAAARLLSEPCRGLQLGIGAAQAQGDVLLGFCTPMRSYQPIHCWR